MSGQRTGDGTRTGAVRLMIPGPVPLSPACAALLEGPVEAHYGPAWAAVHHEIVSLLRRAMGAADADVMLVAGSGSAGLDAAIGSLVDLGERVVVGVNGTFGERLAAIARSHGAAVTEVRAAWGEPISADAVETALDEAGPVAAVLATHVETGTGVVNPVAELAAVAHRRGAAIVVDAVSSVGGMEVAFDVWGLDLCVTCSQKGLGGIPGLAPVAVTEDAWARIERRRAARGWYLDLRTWRAFATRDAAWHPAPVTMPTHAMRVLRQGLVELLDEGIGPRAVRFRGLAARLRAGLRTIGLEPLAEDRWASPVVTAARSLPGVPSGEIVRFVEREHGIRIAGGGPGPLVEAIVRVGHLAPVTSERDIDDVLAALGDFAARRGHARPGVVGAAPATTA